MAGLNVKLKNSSKKNYLKEGVIKMNTAISKMKADYELKIEGCDKLISHLRISIATNRRNGREDKNKDLRKERAIEQAKRQAYVQAKYDFDSLLDCI